MKIKLTSARCGHLFDAKGQHAGEFAHASGDVVEMNEKDARRLIERGQATVADPSNK